MHRKTQGIPLVKKNHFFKIICHITSDGEKPAKDLAAPKLAGRPNTGAETGRLPKWERNWYGPKSRTVARAWHNYPSYRKRQGTR